MKHTRASEESMPAFIFRMTWSIVVGFLFIIPLFTVLYISNEVLRTITNFRLRKKYGPKTHVLAEGCDTVWIYKAENGKRSILYLAINDDPMDLEKHRQNYMEKLLNRPEYQKLLQIFTEDFGFHIQKFDVNFDIRNHVKILEGSEDRVITEEEMMEEILPKLSTEMDDSKPQWEDVIIPMFKYKDEEKLKSARVFRVAHAYMDGGSNLLMIGDTQYEGEDKFPYVVDPSAPLKIALWKRMLYKLNCLLLFGWVVVHGLANPSSKVIKNRFRTPKLSGITSYSWSKPIPIDTLKKIKDTTGESMPTILMSVLGESIRKLNEKHPSKKGKLGENELPPEASKECEQEDEITVGMVSGVFPYPDYVLRNRHSLFHMKMDVSNKTPLERLQSTSEIMKAAMWDPHVYLNLVIPNLFGRTPIWFSNTCMRLLSFPFVLSNIPVAQRRVKLWGNDVLEIGGWPPMPSNCGVGCVTIRYGDTLRFCMNSDKNAISKEELYFLKSQVSEEVQILSEKVAAAAVVTTPPILTNTAEVEEDESLTTHLTRLKETKSSFFQRNFEHNFFHQHSGGNKGSLKFRLNASINTIKDSLSKFREP